MSEILYILLREGGGCFRYIYIYIIFFQCQYIWTCSDKQDVKFNDVTLYMQSELHSFIQSCIVENRCMMLFMFENKTESAIKVI